MFSVQRIITTEEYSSHLHLHFQTDGEKMDAINGTKVSDSNEKKFPKDTKQKRSETDPKGEISIKSTSYRETIPTLEVIFYFAVWIGCLGYSFIAVYFASSKYFGQLQPDSFTQGWIPGQKYKDNSDWEWEFWSSWGRSLITWALCHILISQFAKKKWHWWIHPTYTIIALSSIIGYKLVLIMLGHFAFMHVVSYTYSVIGVWIISLEFLSFLNFSFGTHFIQVLCDEQGLDSKGPYFVQLIFSVMNLHYTSAALHAIKTQHKDYSFLKLLHYCLYFPVILGPFISYEQFQQDVKTGVKCTKLLLLKEIFRIGFWTLVFEVTIHYCYFYAIETEDEVIDKLPLWALAGIAYCIGQYFQVKYVICYGAPSLLMRLDGIAPPRQPQCITTIYFYSEMWKNFDGGLYVFIRDHIYIPLGGSRHGLFWQLFASFCCFTFIYYWHGASYYLMVWSYLNWLGIMIEMVGRTMCRQERIIKHLSPVWMYRLQAVVAVPLYILYLVCYIRFLRWVNG